MNKYEQLKIYSAYLPYNLQFKDYGTLKGIRDWLGWSLVFDDKTGSVHVPIGTVRPYLYDLSYLTKPIEYEGETFVPMIKLLELQETNHFSKNNVIKDSVRFDKTKIIDCKSETYDVYASVTVHKVRYLVETSNIGTLIYSLTYDEYLDRFGSRDETQNRPLGVAHQRQMFEKLYEWHFNVFNLPESEYINKATLTNK